jgi:hypothetical protein
VPLARTESLGPEPPDPSGPTVHMAVTMVSNTSGRRSNTAVLSQRIARVYLQEGSEVVWVKPAPRHTASRVVGQVPDDPLDIAGRGGRRDRGIESREKDMCVCTVPSLPTNDAVQSQGTHMRVYQKTKLLVVVSAAVVSRLRWID